MMSEMLKNLASYSLKQYCLIQSEDADLRGDLLRLPVGNAGDVGGVLFFG